MIKMNNFIIIFGRGTGHNLRPWNCNLRRISLHCDIFLRTAINEANLRRNIRPWNWGVGGGVHPTLYLFSNPPSPLSWLV